MERCSVILLVCGVLAACQHGGAATAKPTPSEQAMVDLKTVLANTASTSLIPELAGADIAALAASERGKNILGWCRGAVSEEQIPETTYTLYRRFRIAGERPPYETPYFDKRTQLTQETLAVWLGGDDGRLDRVKDLLWSICEETTWVVPAHEQEVWTIDLFSAETGSMLAYVALLLGDRLPEEIRERIHREIKSRILDLYLEHGREYWWDSGRNNWTGVCAGSIGETFLLMEPDPARRAQALALVLEQLARFIGKAFEEDGGCLEGIGYWNYGLTHFVCFAEMLRARTAGKIDLLAEPKIKAIARYPLAVWLGGQTYASFSDAHEHSSVSPLLGARLAERANAPELRGLIAGGTHWNLGYMLRNLLWWDGQKETPGAPDTMFLPVSGIARLVGKARDLRLVLAAKAGHNAEPHNHNDVGSFIIAADGETYLCDPGPGLYSKEYFSARRYGNVFANSYGHSVPRIGGQLQREGLQYRGTMEQLSRKSVRVRFEGAYGLADLREAARTFRMDKDTVHVADEFLFDGAGLEIEEAFVTWRPVEAERNTARILGAKGVLIIRAETGTFTVERLEEASKANRASDVLTRLTVTYPAGKEITARFTMIFKPAME